VACAAETEHARLAGCLSITASSRSRQRRASFAAARKISLPSSNALSKFGVPVAGDNR
jgi:uncharacterized membrane protein YeaQ/YmgE (transglycosylase-associated protein family)